MAGAACEGGPRTCRGKALRAGEAVGVDAQAGKAVLAPRGILVFYQGYGGARQGASEVEIAALRSADNAGSARLPQIRGALSLSHSERENVPFSTEAGLRRQAYAHPGLGYRKVVQRSAPMGS